MPHSARPGRAYERPLRDVARLVVCAFPTWAPAEIRGSTRGVCAFQIAGQAGLCLMVIEGGISMDAQVALSY